MNRIKFIVFFFILTQNCLGQNIYVDSLIKYLQEHPEQDTTRVMNTHRLSYRLSEIDPVRAWKFAVETEELAKKIGFTKGECLSNINYAILESNEGNFKNSADYYIKAIHIAESINFDRGLSISYNNIGDNYLKLKEYDKVIEYSQKALELNKKINELRGQAINLEQIGQVYFLQNDFENALKYWNEGFTLAKKSEDPNIYAQILIDLGKYYNSINQKEKALNLIEHADSISKSTNELYLQILCNKAQSSVYKNTDPNRLVYLKRALSNSILLKNRTEECELYNLIADHYEQIGKFDSGIYYLRKHKVLSDSVLNDKNFAHIAFVQTKYETQLKEKENKELKAIQKSQTKKLSVANWLLIASILALVLAILSIFLIVRSFKHTEQTKELEEQKKVSEYKQQLAELEVRSLRSQMNPHFLFNSLNSIRNYIIKNEPQKASNYLANFATLMRKILDASQQSFISLEEEIDMLNRYLQLELMRFSNKFEYKIEVDPTIEISNISIPSMVLQPFIENAIWHGLLNKDDETGILKIRFMVNIDNADEIIGEVIDNGIGRVKSSEMSNSLKKHKSKGIQITIDRLLKLTQYHTEEPVLIEDLYDEFGEAKGTKVTVHLPIS